ncbi:MAG: DNRLRE domain-containing protein [Bacteroidota bacterium]
MIKTNSEPVGEHTGLFHLRNLLSYFVFFVTLGFAIQACMEEPTPVGSRLLPPSDLLKIDTATTVSVGSTSQKVIPNPSFPFRLLVGKFDESESWGVIRFSQLPDSLILVNVVGAELNLRVNYHFGDSLAPFSMDVHKVLQNWGSDSLTIDSLRSAGFYETAPLAVVNAGAVHDSAVITIPLDTALVRSWLNAPSDTVITNFGLLLRPTNTAVVKGFATSIASTESHRPHLVVRYTRTGTTQVDTATVAGSTEAFGASTSNTSWLSDSTRIYVRNGLSYRGMIDFDIASLPAGTSIHKAVLEVTLDPTASRFNSYTSDSLFAYFVTDDGVVQTVSALSVPVIVDGRKTYQFQVSTFAQLWLRRNYPRRIAIAGYTEEYSLDSFVLFGAPSPLKPKLIITYSAVL